MRTSETVSEISKALLMAQKSIAYAVKDAKNPHFKSTYADLPAVIDAVKPALNNAGIVFIQTLAASAPGTLSLTTRLMHESGEWLEDTATIPLPKNDPQGYGSATTYGRRYALAAITGLYQDDDDGNAASSPVPARQSKPAAPPVAVKPIDAAELELIVSTMSDEDDLDTLKTFFAAAWKRATPEQQSTIKAAYDAKRDTLTTKQ